MKEELQFIKSDFCHECDGCCGYISDHDGIRQCEECERLHKEEVRADMMHDLLKEGF